MKLDTRTIARGVQDTLDQLFKESLIPFKLTAYNVKEETPGEYLVSFFDSRLHSVRFFLRIGESLDAAVRIVVRARIGMLSESVPFFRKVSAVKSTSPALLSRAGY